MEEKDERDRLLSDAEEGPDVEGHGMAPPGSTAPPGAAAPPGRSDEGDDDVEAHQFTPPGAANSANI
jgi:hypothetical protein